MNSYVIIRREYSYLEPLVRSVFADADDVTVLIDRRAKDRQAVPSLHESTTAGNGSDRRASTPMLDILINVQA